MLLLIIRTIMLYFLILLMMKVMGKRQIGQLQPFELAVVLIFSEMASASMQSTAAPVLNSVVPIIVITVIQIAMAMLNLKNERLRDCICGKPSVVISNGQVSESELRRLRMNINDLLEQLRANGYFDISEVAWAIMETNGQLSVMPKSNKRPLTPDDLNLTQHQEQPGRVVILDGKINDEALRELNKDRHWLEKQLKKQKIEQASDVFIAATDSGGQLFCQLKERVQKNG